MARFGRSKHQAAAPPAAALLLKRRLISGNRTLCSAINRSMRATSDGGNVLTRRCRPMR